MKKFFLVFLILIGFGYGGDIEKVELLNQKVIEAYQKDDYIVALKYNQKIINLYENYNKHNTNLELYYTNQAEILLSLERYKEAISFYYKALKMSKNPSKIKLYKNSISIANYKLGLYFEKVFQYSKSILYFKKSLILNLELYDEDDIAIFLVYDKLSTIYFNMEKYDEAFKTIAKY